MCGGYVTGEAMLNTEEYNGSGWSAGGNTNTARYALRSAGTQTSAIILEVIQLHIKCKHQKI